MRMPNVTTIVLTIVCSGVLALGIGGCSSFGFEGDVTAEADPPELYLRNQTNRTIYYIAGDENDLARMDIDLSDYSDWPTAAPGRTAKTSYADLAFYDEGDTRAWIYWTTENGDDGSLNVSLD